MNLDPSFEEFTWAVCLFGAYGEDDAYKDVMSNGGTINNGRELSNISTPQLKSIIKFLNKYRCRVPVKGTEGRKFLRTLNGKIRSNSDYLNQLHGKNLENFQLSDSVIVQKIFSSMVGGADGIGPTVASKTLHVLKPDLFVMWDIPIIKAFSEEKGARLQANGNLYSSFMECMQAMAQRIQTRFGDKGKGETICAYLNECVAPGTPKTMAKFIDEYNWISVTKKVKLPPAWARCTKLL